MKSSLLIYFEKYNIDVLKIKKHCDPVIIEKIIKAIDLMIDDNLYKKIIDNDVIGRCYVGDMIYIKNTDWDNLFNEDEKQKLKENCNNCPLNINYFYLNDHEKLPPWCVLDDYDDENFRTTHKERMLWFRDYMMKCLEIFKYFDIINM